MNPREIAQDEQEHQKVLKRVNDATYLFDRIGSGKIDPPEAWIAAYSLLHDLTRGGAIERLREECRRHLLKSNRSPGRVLSKASASGVESANTRAKNQDDIEAETPLPNRVLQLYNGLKQLESEYGED